MLAGGLAAVTVIARHAVAAAVELRVDMVDLRRLTGEIGALRADAHGLRQRLVDPRRGTGAAHQRDTATPGPGAAGHALGARIDR